MTDYGTTTIEALVAQLSDGAVVAAMKDTSGAPMALARAIIRKGVRNLHVVCVPTGGFFADILIGAGCVATVEGGGVSLGEYGQAPCFVRAVKSGAVRPLDTTCPAVYAALQAGEKGIPFMPLRGLIGSDILAYRNDYKIIPNPMAEGGKDPIVAIPALKPDLAFIHAPLADREGNLWIGHDHELRILAHAARHTVATAEAIVDGRLGDDPLRAAGTIPALYVDAVALAPRGALPCGMAGLYAEDAAALAGYVRAAATPEGFRAWLEGFLEPAEPVRRAAE
ncbi:MAG: CoA synthetase [Rhodospirillaceae bacterium]|nr:CoA synthetase [Rhodospirillaceae bacterium]